MKFYERLYPSLRLLTSILCCYEAVQIWRHGLTLSKLAQRYPWIGPALIAALTLHICMISEQDPHSLAGNALLE